MCQSALFQIYYFFTLLGEKIPGKLLPRSSTLSWSCRRFTCSTSICRLNLKFGTIRKYPCFTIYFSVHGCGVGTRWCVLWRDASEQGETGIFCYLSCNLLLCDVFCLLLSKVGEMERWLDNDVAYCLILVGPVNHTIASWCCWCC